MSTPVGVHATKGISECKRKQYVCEDGEQIFEDEMGTEKTSNNTRAKEAGAMLKGYRTLTKRLGTIRRTIKSNQHSKGWT